MRYGQMMRNYLKAPLAIVALGLIGACADNQTAPVSQRPTVKAPANFTVVGEVVTFRVDNSVGIVERIGDHVVSIPAGAICDMETSGYGPTYWDAPCDPLLGSVVITASVLEDADGQPYIDFQPNMRFAPDKDVVLFLRQGYNSAKTKLILRYCDANLNCVDESDSDNALRPFRVNNTPVLGRRIKHFTGYMIGSGEECPGSVYDNGDGTYWCEEGEGGITRRSGYMVASGEDIGDIMKEDPILKDEKEK